jgi:Spy/CpxP family protein refolding chaperone
MEMEKTKARGEAALLIAVVFMLGALLGAVATHMWGERVWGRQDTYSAGRKPVNQVVADFTRELQLTPDQQTQVTTIIDDTRAQLKALYAPVDMQREQIRQQTRARIRALLTPEQQPKFDAFMRRLDEQRAKDQAAH